MKAAVFIPAMMAASLCAGAAAAQAARFDPEETPRVFREAVLGFCAERVLGQAIVPHSIDPAGDEWVDVRRDVIVTGGQRIFAGRIHRNSAVIVDLSPGEHSCFVQAPLIEPSTDILERLRAEILDRPGAMLLDERNTPEGHHALYGLIDEQSDLVPIFALNGNGPENFEVTVIVAMGAKGN